MVVPIDREQWSESSKRSYAYQYRTTAYEDIEYQCGKCGATDVFAAKDQKLAYEVKKQYIWRRRTLCSTCNGELYRLRIKENEFQSRWSQNRTVLRNDRDFLFQWLQVLKAIPTYRQRARSSMRSLLERLLQSHA